MKKRSFIIILILVLGGISVFSKEIPSWLECDSVKAIESRIKRDFSLSLSEGTKKIRQLYPDIDTSKIRDAINSHYIETKVINGEEYMHYKSPKNFKLLSPTLRGKWIGRGTNPENEDIEMVRNILYHSLGNGDICCGKRIKYRFSIDVPKNKHIINDTLKVWMPVPLETTRQKNIKIHSTSQEDYVLSSGYNSNHNTIFFKKSVTEKSDSIVHFEYIGEYDTYGQYYSPEFIKKNIKPYDKHSNLYIKYTDVNHKHIINLKTLAYQIVKNETNPYLQSELVYDYISKTYPWAGAREYSTIESLPQYVLDELHGDCGQVALLYISLMRSLGVPAKWESGWMLHPWSQNLHDWAEVYFEGIGWVPVDVSFGRYVNSIEEQERKFFSTGMDNYRFATNNGICSPLYPSKEFIRSETVDFQVGEVECSKGNIFYPGWKRKLEVLSIEDIND